LAELLLKKLIACRERIERIRAKLPENAASILTDDLLEAFLSFHIFLLVQDASDIANHLVAANGLGIPGSQRDAFLALARAGTIARETAVAMGAAAGLRNRIAHAYGDVDPVRLVEEAPEGLAAIGRFLDEIGATISALGA